MIGLFTLTFIVQTGQQGGSQLGAPVAIKPIVMFDGAEGKLNGPMHVLVQDAKSWNEWWSKIHGLKQPAWGKNEPPVVDFERFDIVVVASGPSWNSYGITFPEVVRGHGQTTVRYVHRSYQTSGPGGGGVRCNPWGVAVIDKVRPNLMFPKVQVTFEENVQRLIGQAPVWEVKAELTLTKDS